MALVDIEGYITAKIESGLFASRQDFLLETARVYRTLEEQHAQLCTTIEERLRQADADELEPLDIAAIKRELSQELDEEGHPL
jgi:Arc/MetJ-type ribon-helix-helix transcriptional regulator